VVARSELLAVTARRRQRNEGHARRLEGGVVEVEVRQPAQAVGDSADVVALVVDRIATAVVVDVVVVADVAEPLAVVAGDDVPADDEEVLVPGLGRAEDVADVVDAILKLDKCPEAVGKPVNIGVNQEISIFDLAKKVIDRTKSQSDISYQSYDDAYSQGFEDMERRVPDNTLLRNLTGWNPTRTIDNIIDDLVAFLS